jgi:hypothetical protein
LQGRKTIELRKWNTSFRGLFLIHASKNPDLKAMNQFGFKELPCGCIVGKAEIVDVKHYANEEEHAKDKEFHLASSAWGNFGFIIKNAKRVKVIPCKGNLGFWDFKGQEPSEEI